MNKRSVALAICMVLGMSIGTSTGAKADLNDGWIKTNDGWNYYENGSIKTGWLNDGGNYYYLKDDGNMATGWIKVDNSWFYLNPSGEMKTGWLNDNGKWYYLDKNGVMVFNTTIDGYYLGTDGVWIPSSSSTDNTTKQDESNLQDLTMKTEKSIYELGTREIKVYITNNSKKEVYYGLQYEVEKFENNNWIKVPFKEEVMIAQIAYSLQPGKTSTQVISLENFNNLTAGKYRIVKLGGTLTAEFELK
ncbi:immunoglobulin-like domain-containing protein [Clostridium sp.]|uniref:immunoglobulin-like domain-containing protein n=1 Tax=Clostridium sp. TaxID=1506 RepID=UPI0028484C91|nr:immunoglobulin-like domain-containing protein [Clostridium sp.]MDR3598307.1 N-acetylmuramoyl-L-alanine amidase family protein [Clostridium sp.]